MASEVEDLLKRIQSHRGVIGTIVVNNEGSCSLLERFPSKRYMLTCQTVAQHHNDWSIIFTGIPIKSTLDNSTSVQYAGLIQQLADKARSVVRDLDPSNDLMFLRMRTKKHEIMVAPGKFDYVFLNYIRQVVKFHICST